MIRTIRNLTMSRKFMLIGVLTLGMVAPPAWLAISSELQGWMTARSELQGVARAGLLLKLVQLTQQHRGLSAMQLGGDAGAAAARQAKQAEVEQALARARESAQDAGLPQLQSRAEAAAREWQAIVDDLSAQRIDGAQSFARHTRLVEAQLRWLDGVVDASHLSLDPEAGTSHLVNAVLDHAPRLAESLGQMRAQGAMVLAKGQAAPEDMMRVSSLVDTARLHAREVSAMFEDARAADASLASAIDRPVAGAASAIEEALKLAEEKMLHAGSASLPPQEYWSAMTRVIDAQFRMIDATFAALADALAAREAKALGELLLVVVSGGVFAALAVAMGVLVSRTTTRSIGTALKVAQTVAAGDLTCRIEVDSEDEAGQMLRALEAMTRSLGGIVRQVRQSSDAIATGSAQIASGNADLSQRTEEQASNLQQTAATMEQLTSAVQHNADTAHQASALAVSAREAASRGGVVVGQVVGTMDEITTSSKRIADIIGVIDGIAFQTNILALNAAVEAARAGEQGRGFAVVASEVRSLAQRSADAAKEIKGLISDSVDKVEAGSRLVNDAGQSMKEIVEQVRRVTDLIAEISAASAEQNQGIGEVGSAVSQLDEVTQQNAALVEESAAAAESLRQQASHLAHTVDVFRLAHA